MEFTLEKTEFNPNMSKEQVKSFFEKDIKRLETLACYFDGMSKNEFSSKRQIVVASYKEAVSCYREVVAAYFDKWDLLETIILERDKAMEYLDKICDSVKKCADECEGQEENLEQ